MKTQRLIGSAGVRTGRKTSTRLTQRPVLSLWLVLALGGLLGGGCTKHPSSSVPSPGLVTVTYGISPFQDTLLPILGSDKYKGWYRQEGLNVQFKILGWTEVQEALAAGQVDVAINNESSLVATHNKRPDLVYWYGVNTFDNGFALMIRPDGKMKTVAQLEKIAGSHEKAVAMAAAQLKGKTVVTTSNTDMEQGVSAAARRGGLNFKNDVKIINLNPDDGLAAFLSGTGDAYIGGIPQRTRAGKEGMQEMLSGIDLGPAPINGLVTTRAFATAHPDELLKLLHVWFKIVNYVNTHPEDGGQIIVTELNQSSGAKFTQSDFNKFWQHYEHYPLTPAEAGQDILDPKGRNYWKARWDDCNNYFYGTVHVIPQPVQPAGVFLMGDTQRAYIQKYGDGTPH